MTTTPLTEQQLDEIATAVADYRRHVPTGWACCSAHPVADAGAMLLAEVRRLSAALTEMTRCRDNALRALYRDDVETDIDLEETIAAPFYGPGWDWDASDLKPVVREAVAAIRPAFGKLTQERDRLRAELAAEAGQAELTLDRVRRIASRLAAHAVGFGDVLDESDRGPWAKTVGADIAELAAALSPAAAPEPAPVPQAASQPPEAPVEGETDGRVAAGHVEESGAARIALTRSDLAALLAHHADVLAARWRAVAPGAGAWEVAAALALTSHANELSAETERPAVAELLDNIWTFPLEQQAKARCGLDIETALGTYPCERDAGHGGDCDERTEVEYAAALRAHHTQENPR